MVRGLLVWTRFAAVREGVAAGQRRRWRPKGQAGCVAAAVLVGVALFAAQASDVRTLSWDDLLPEGEVAPPQAVDHSRVRTVDDFPVVVSVGVVDELDGVEARLPGFVVPLDVTEGKVSSLLLVPYFGACIHQPPPPANQIVHVTFSKPVAVESMYDPVWVTGKMGLEHYAGGLAEASYSMAGRGVEKYEY